MTSTFFVYLQSHNKQLQGLDLGSRFRNNENIYTKIYYTKNSFSCIVNG